MTAGVLLAGSSAIAWLISIARWPLLWAIVALLFAFVYRFGPSREHAKWRWITWGSAGASLAWLVASILFSWYAANFGSYNKTYGSLGAVIGFMTWMWLSTIVVLIGAEFDAEMEGVPTDESGRGAAASPRRQRLSDELTREPPNRARQG